MSITEIDQQYVARTYGRFPIELVSGQGSVLVDSAGREYIDMGSGIAVNTFGACDPQWQQAVIDQLGKVQHTSNLYYTQPCAELAQALCNRTGMKRVFFGNSGAEANECIIKVARKYAAETKGPDYYTIITMENSFHGRTLTTLAATGQECFHKLFQPLTPGFVSVPINDVDALEAALAANKVAGILVECIQGEGGVNVLDDAYVQAIAAICQRDDLVFLVDEVQTGNGRTGSLYSYMHYGVQPDAISTAKGLAGGLPIGAALLGEKVQDVLGLGDHGSTFGGNPVCCAAALNVLSRIDDELLAQVQAKSQLIFDTLTGAPGIEAVVGRGLLVGIKATKAPAEMLAACQERGVLCLSAKDKLRLAPPLNIPEDQLRQALEAIKEAAIA